MTVSKFGLY